MYYNAEHGLFLNVFFFNIDMSVKACVGILGLEYKKQILRCDSLAGGEDRAEEAAKQRWDFRQIRLQSSPYEECWNVNCTSKFVPTGGAGVGLSYSCTSVNWPGV